MNVGAVSRRDRFHHYGPLVLGGGAILGAIIFEAFRHHVLDRYSALFIAILIPTVILHEISHGVVAYWFGDTTARDAGRLSLNPLRHIDPLGTVLLPLLLIVTTGSAFGWAKPVPVATNRLRHPRNEAVLVGLAGPAMNIIIALLSGFAFRIVTHGNFDPEFLNQLPLGEEALFTLGLVNVIIAVFNLIPIPPLDGSAVVERFLPTSALPTYYRIRPYSMLFVLFLVFFAPGALDTLFSHAITIWADITGV